MTSTSSATDGIDDVEGITNIEISAGCPLRYLYKEQSIQVHTILQDWQCKIFAPSLVDYNGTSWK